MSFEIEGVKELIDSMKLVQNNYPKEIKSFMQSEGNKLKKLTLKVARSKVKKRTGNYEKGIKRGKYYKYSKNGVDSIRVYAGKPAYHRQLIEFGHKMVTHEPQKKQIGFVEGYHIFKNSGDNFESRYEKDCDKFAEKIVEQLNKG